MTHTHKPSESRRFDIEGFQDATAGVLASSAWARLY